MHRVVITGLGVLTSIGLTKNTFWEGLRTGRSGVRTITNYDMEGQRCTCAGQIRDFDLEAHVGGKQARRMDRTCQLGVSAARQVIADSGLRLDEVDRNRIGVLTGTCNPMDWIWKAHQAYFTRGVKAVNPFTVLATFPDAAASNIALDLGLHGTNLTLSSACSSSADALGYALSLIRSGILDRAITGGVEAPVVFSTITAFGAARALSGHNDTPETASRPFDRTRDGFVLGEGAGLVLLERLDLALARGAHIYGELAGYGSTCDAWHMTAPREDCEQQARAVEMALKDAGVTIEQVDYINAHGTSTPLNDVTETRTIKKVFGNRAYSIPISSTKSMVGHTLGAAGGIEVVATLLSMQEGMIHPTINYQEPDPDCDLDYTVEGARELKVDVAVSNSFGFGGKNSVLVLKRFEG